MRTWPLIAALLLGACPAPDGSPPAGDDDDAAGAPDDDDAASDSVTFAGRVGFEADGRDAPTGDVRVGLFVGVNDEARGPGHEAYGTLVVQGALADGWTDFAVVVDGEPSDDDFGHTAPGAQVATYFFFSYLDADEDGAFTAGEDLLGGAPVMLMYVRVIDEHDADLDAGWYTVLRADILDGGDVEMTPVPEGTTADEGPQLASSLVPVTRGAAPATSPGGDRLALVLASYLDGSGDAADPEAFAQAAGASLEIDGAPPAEHLAPTDIGDGHVDLPTAVYRAVAFTDADGDGRFTPGSCDELVAASRAEVRYLDPTAMELTTAEHLLDDGLEVGWWVWDVDEERYLALEQGLDLVDDPSLPESGCR